MEDEAVVVEAGSVLGRGDVTDAPVERARHNEHRLVELVGCAEQVVPPQLLPHTPPPLSRPLRRRPALTPLVELLVVARGKAGGEGGLGGKRSRSTSSR